MFAVLWQRCTYRLLLLLVLLLVTYLVPHASAQQTDFGYVQIWAGDPNATQEAVFVIDWDDGQDCVVWGYRWDSGAVDGRTMLEAIKVADPRLFEREGDTPGGFPGTIYGLGYDQDGDGFPGLNEQPNDGSRPLDSDDRYREGWNSAGYWYLSQDRSTADGTWSGHSPVQGPSVENGGAFGARFIPFFPVSVPPAPASCVPAASPNTPPTLTAINATGNEDTSIPLSAADFTRSFTDDDGDSLQQVRISSLPTHGTLQLDTTPVTANQAIDVDDLDDLAYIPDPHFNNTPASRDQFDWNGSDGTAYANSEAVVNLLVVPVNDAPSFTGGGDPPAVASDAGPQTIKDWATSIRPGPAQAVDEAGQALTFKVTTDTPTLFAKLPAVSADGTLTYTPNPDASGRAVVTVVLRDDGGTERGGSDTSAPQTLTITTNAVAPSVTPTSIPPSPSAIPTTDTSPTTALPTATLRPTPSSTPMLTPDVSPTATMFATATRTPRPTQRPSATITATVSPTTTITVDPDVTSPTPQPSPTRDVSPGPGTEETHLFLPLIYGAPDIATQTESRKDKTHEIDQVTLVRYAADAALRAE